MMCTSWRIYICIMRGIVNHLLFIMTTPTHDSVVQCMPLASTVAVTCLAVLYFIRQFITRDLLTCSTAPAELMSSSSHLQTKKPKNES